MKLLDREEPMDPRAREELEAIDRALAGAVVEPEHEGLAELTALIADERPDPDDEWAAELDRAAAAGFSRRGSASPAGGLREKLSGIRPMRIAGPAGALATVIVVAVVAISTLGGGGGNDSATSMQEAPATVDSASSGDAGGGDSAVSEEALSDVAPAVRDYAGKDGGKIAPGTERRQVDRDVQMTLSTKPDEVRNVSDRVIAITRSLDGIVASSQVTVVDGNRGSQATLQLTLPSRNLDAAIDQLTELANVESLNEATEDITRPFVSAQDEVDDLQAQRRRLLEALGNATTVAEADSLRLQIEDIRHDISDAEAALENIARRARLSDLSVTVVGDPNAKEDRDLGDWLDDAISVLRDVAGVLLISAAILVPLGILVALVWFAASRARRRRRERALNQ
jgi:hypothetical protein